MEESGKDVGTEMGACPENGYRLRALGAAPSWCKAGAGGVLVQCGGFSLREKALNSSSFTCLWVACSFLPA